MPSLCPEFSLSLRADLRRRIAACEPFALVRIPSGMPESGLYLFDRTELCESAPDAATPYFRISPWDDASRGFAPRSERDYISRVSRLVSFLGPELPKVVFSRTIQGSLQPESVPDKALRLFDSFPAAVGLLYYTPATGLWLAATPELLLESSPDGTLRTMALAGTRPADIHGLWDDKNMREHRHVVDFISDTFLRAGITDIAVGPTGTLRYGSISHLHTPLAASSVAPEVYDRLLSALSPTPALCGLPRARARHMIEALEPHSRGCYGGYVDFRLQASSLRRAFVVLRCAHVDLPSGTWTAFAGGGIVSGSDPHEEWEETVRKSARLVDILSSGLDAAHY